MIRPVMSLTRAAPCLIVLLGLLAGADARACEAEACFDLPAIPALVVADERPPGPALIIDEAFNEIAATDDDESPVLKSALIAHRTSSNAFASLGVPVPEAEPADEPIRPATASLVPPVPAVSVAALLLIFMLACIALVERRSAGGVTPRTVRRPTLARQVR
jgi:hypothetical protein